MNTTKKKTSRLTREEWLRLALDSLAEQGTGALKVQNLAEALGVTRGSFYWHFTDRAEFISALLNYWHDRYTLPVPDLVAAYKGSGKEKFLCFLRTVFENDLTRFDLPIRSWAMQDPEVEEQVRRTDKFRLEFTKNLFIEMGFSNSQADLRAHSCVSYLIMGRQLLDVPTKKITKKQLHEICAFFCSPC
ncbi:MAG: TetR/AcrR family transcriptional regulator [Pseudomonadales bacterium]